ncbi:hypothetical protein DFA_06806 [Cavenderia fasciculata]|uniref:Uncharacterized protein n=1 Tax=Cavenderia fasciculata TaxID=261658 RepID=F4Q2B9_CACFS|nr:uncharacterized protein DFA_06806 [Cavenderia fasciculata]EGG18139.1 hypothetical protein DFA_06806 [Cavenderia fasciculata]|eukprot:XP_004366180.1 hypothetical protein DFA_06806 [Cavenderia fasciculata]
MDLVENPCFLLSYDISFNHNMYNALTITEIASQSDFKRWSAKQVKEWATQEVQMESIAVFTEADFGKCGIVVAPAKNIIFFLESDERGKSNQFIPLFNAKSTTDQRLMYLELVRLFILNVSNNPHSEPTNFLTKWIKIPISSTQKIDPRQWFITSEESEQPIEITIDHLLGTITDPKEKSRLMIAEDSLFSKSIRITGEALEKSLASSVCQRILDESELNFPFLQGIKIHNKCAEHIYHVFRFFPIFTNIKDVGSFDMKMVKHLMEQPLEGDKGIMVHTNSFKDVWGQAKENTLYKCGSKSESSDFYIKLSQTKDPRFFQSIAKCNLSTLHVSWTNSEYTSNNTTRPFINQLLKSMSINQTLIFVNLDDEVEQEYNNEYEQEDDDDGEEYKSFKEQIKSTPNRSAIIRTYIDYFDSQIAKDY